MRSRPEKMGKILRQPIPHSTRTRNPHSCTHGRPIHLSLEEASLMSFLPAALSDW